MPAEHATFQGTESVALSGQAASVIVRLWMASEILKVLSKTSDAVFTMLIRFWRMSSGESNDAVYSQSVAIPNTATLLVVGQPSVLPILLIKSSLSGPDTWRRKMGILPFPLVCRGSRFPDCISLTKSCSTTIRDAPSCDAILTWYLWEKTLNDPSKSGFNLSWTMYILAQPAFSQPRPGYRIKALPLKTLWPARPTVSVRRISPFTLICRVCRLWPRISWFGSRFSCNSPSCSPGRLNVRLNSVEAVTRCDGVWMVTFSRVVVLPMKVRGRIECAIYIHISLVGST